MGILSFFTKSKAVDDVFDKDNGQADHRTLGPDDLRDHPS